MPAKSRSRSVGIDLQGPDGIVHVGVLPQQLPGRAAIVGHIDAPVGRAGIEGVLVHRVHGQAKDVHRAEAARAGRAADLVPGLAGVAALDHPAAGVGAGDEGVRIVGVEADAPDILQPGAVGLRPAIEAIGGLAGQGAAPAAVHAALTQSGVPGPVGAAVLERAGSTAIHAGLVAVLLAVVALGA